MEDTKQRRRVQCKMSIEANVNAVSIQRGFHRLNLFVKLIWNGWNGGRAGSRVCVCVWMFARARTLAAKANASIFDSKRIRVFIYIRWRGTKCWCWSCCYQQKCTMTLIWFICSQFECKQRTETKSIKLWISKSAIDPKTSIGFRRLQILMQRRNVWRMLKNR